MYYTHTERQTVPLQSALTISRPESLRLLKGVEVVVLKEVLEPQIIFYDQHLAVRSSDMHHQQL